MVFSEFLNGYTSVSLYSQYSHKAHILYVFHKKMLCCTKKSVLNSVGGVGQILVWVARVEILAWVTWWCEWRGSIKYSLNSYRFFPIITTYSSFNINIFV